MHFSLILATESMKFHTAEQSLAIDSVLKCYNFIIHYILQKNFVITTLEELTFTCFPNFSQGQVRYSLELGMCLCHMCFTHLFSMLYLLLLLVTLYGMSAGFHMESVFIFIDNRPLRIQSGIVRSSPINLLPDLPSIQVSPTHHFKHNNKPFPFSKKGTDNISLCGPAFVNSIISGTGWTRT